MRRLFGTRWGRVLATALIAALAFAAGSAVAAVATAPATEIYACAANNSGTLRVVNADTTCRPSETKLAWSIQGPQGPQGSQGAAAASLVTARLVGLPSMNGMPTDQYGAISGLSTPSGDQGSVAMLSGPAPTIARDLTVRYTAAPLGGNRVVTLLVNGVPSALSCMASGDVASCTNTQDVVAIPGSASLALQVHTEGLVQFIVPATDVLVTWRATTP